MNGIGCQFVRRSNQAAFGGVYANHSLSADTPHAMVTMV